MKTTTMHPTNHYPLPTGTILTTTTGHHTHPRTHFYRIKQNGKTHTWLQPLTRTTTKTHATPGHEDPNQPLQIHPNPAPGHPLTIENHPLHPWDGTPQPHYEP